ncbi:hypothetical protein C1H46_039698 [Malus baccata]|uniref:Uncharacterized protein n=1 Tax=Malus baccata TaxID=106549 RepID=A0A540KL71_MALBA|nr:hypothetical protein C1H46_039698 [Malus baccata]
MARGSLDIGAPNGAFSSAQISEHKESTGPSYIDDDDDDDDGGVQVTCFSEVVNETTFHLQIIRLPKQLTAIVTVDGLQNSTVGVTSILGGASDNTGSGIARRLVLKTGLNIILPCNIPKNSPMLEADAEKLLVQKLINLGYTRPKSEGF